MNFCRKILIILLLCGSAVASAQVINGRVTDASTHKPVANVSIYYDGSSIGTASDAEGNFSVKFLENNATHLIFSSIGYQSLDVGDYSANKPLDVSLTPKVIQLRTVNIGFDGKSDIDKENWFKREFLGKDDDRNGCFILNMNDILLSYSTEEKLLTGYADQPVQVKNPYLGYTIKYGLEVFLATSSRIAFQGYQFFEEDVPLTGKSREEILERRDKAYYGSKMHFIRSLWDKSLEKEGFAIFNGGWPLTAKDILVERDGKKYLLLNSKLTVVYKKRSTILIPKIPGRTIEIDSRGYFDPSGLLWNGEMSKQRIAGLLPYDFQPAKKR